MIKNLSLTENISMGIHLTSSTQHEKQTLQKYKFFLEAFLCFVYILQDLKENCSIAVFVQMPFDIRSLNCPTHKINSKVSFQVIMKWNLFITKRFLKVKITGDLGNGT